MIVPQCAFCKHYQPGAALPARSAFPERIPQEIFFEGRDHSKPYPGGHGILFEPIDEEAAELSWQPEPDDDDEEQGSFGSQQP